MLFDLLISESAHCFTPISWRASILTGPQIWKGDQFTCTSAGHNRAYVIMNCSGEEKFNAGVVLTDSGAIKNPMNVDVILIAINIACSLVGIPLNCFTGLVILHLRRLRSKPRNIFLLGIVASNLSAFIPPIIETVHFFRPGDEVACKSYLAVVGLPEVFLLLNMLISLLDRYHSTYPFWLRNTLELVLYPTGTRRWGSQCGTD